MKSNVKNLIATLIFFFVDVFFPKIHKRNKGETRILVFHHLDEPVRFKKVIMKLSTRYNLISFNDYLSNNISKEKVNVIISFDDGYESWYQNGSEIFIEYNVKPILSINSDFIGLDGSSAHQYCVTNINTWPERSLTWDQVIELRDLGAYICGHAHTHIDLTERCTEQALKGELISKDKELLEENLNITIEAFTYPYGRFDDSTVKFMIESDYKLAFTSNSGFLHKSQFPYKIKRTNVGMRHYFVVYSYVEGWSEFITDVMKKTRNLIN